MRILLSNMDGLAAYAARDGCITCCRPRANGRVGLLGWLLRSFRYEMVVINCSPGDVLAFAAWKTLLPWWPCRLVSVDMVLPVPATATRRQRARLRLKRFLLRRVDVFIEYFNDARGYEQHYGIDPARWVFVPFKINDYDNVRATATSDGGYVFCTGRTRRDFATLIRACQRVGCPLRILTMTDAELGEHDSHLDESDLPANVEIVRQSQHDPFVETMAAARIVAIPIKARNISASGISVTLTALGLGKCVVVSDGPATRGFLDAGQVCTVPPEDVDALAAVLHELWNDAAAREVYAQRAAAFARSLGGAERLYADIHRVLERISQHGPRAVAHQ